MVCGAANAVAGSSAHTISKANSKHENFVIRCFIICYILLGLFIDKVLRNFHSNHAAKPLQGHALRAANIPKRQPVKSFSRGMYGSALRSKRFQAVLLPQNKKKFSRFNGRAGFPAGDVFTGIQPFSLCETLRLDGGQNPAELRGINRSAPQVGKISKPHPQRKIIQQRA